MRHSKHECITAELFTKHARLKIVSARDRERATMYRFLARESALSTLLRCRAMGLWENWPYSGWKTVESAESAVFYWERILFSTVSIMSIYFDSCS